MDKCWKLAETAMKHYAGAPMPVTVRGQNGVQTTFNIKPRSRLVKLMQHSARMCASWAAAAPLPETQRRCSARAGEGTLTAKSSPPSQVARATGTAAL